MKKCLVLDLDNTIWGGVIGEDGIHNIALSTQAPGNSYLAFQQAILDLYNRGVILAINSRNNPDDAWEVIRNHPNQLLKEHHFAAYRINWQDKAQNIQEIAQELNIGLDSLVFLDDDPTNRELVRNLVPEVEVPELPEDPVRYASFLNSLPYFVTHTTTDEDKMRGNLYVTERLRLEEQKTFESKEAFLASLDLELFIFESDMYSAARIAQLTEKTNQFNTNKIPYSQEDILTFIEDPTKRVFHGRLQDKFGDYGIIVVALVDVKDEVWHITTLLMSCRVFGKGVEYAFISHLINHANKEGVKDIALSFQETQKNVPAKQFIDKEFPLGIRSTANTVMQPTWITIHYEKNI